MIKDTGRVLHEPYATMKDGHLRSKKKNKKSPLSVADDLAAMEDLEDVLLLTVKGIRHWSIDLTHIYSHTLTHTHTYIEIWIVNLLILWKTNHCSNNSINQNYFSIIQYFLCHNFAYIVTI